MMMKMAHNIVHKHEQQCELHQRKGYCDILYLALHWQLTLFVSDLPANVKRCFVLAHYTAICHLSKLGMDVMA